MDFSRRGELIQVQAARPFRKNLVTRSPMKSEIAGSIAGAELMTVKASPLGP
jgi:hypothetical protein